MKKVIILLFLLLGIQPISRAQVDNNKVLELIEGQQYKELAIYLENSYPNGTDDPKILFRLGYAYFMSSNLPKAELTYIKLLGKDSLNTITLRNLANVANKRGDLKQVIKYYNKILLLDSNNFMVTKQLAFAYEQLNDALQEFNYIKKANKINPLDADVAYDYSLKLLSMLKIAEADSVLTKALSADSTNIILLKGKLAINYINEDYKKVVESGEKLFALGDDSNETKNKVGIGYYYQKEYQKCINLMKLLEVGNVETETTLYYTGLSYRKLKQLDKSNEYFMKAIDAGISKNTGIYYQELGVNQESLKKFNTSLYHYKKSLEYKDNDIIKYSMARIYDTELNKPEKAISYYKVFVKQANRAEKESLPYILYSEARIKELMKR